MTNAAASTECPSTVDLERLVRGRLTEARATVLSEHVGACCKCQEQLDHLAGGHDLAEKLREVEEEHPPRDSAYWKALDAAEDEVRITALAMTRSIGPEFGAAADDMMLDFLKPTDHPERLGRLGQFEILREVGRGGMGIVLHAYDPCLQRDVAIKVIDPKLAHNEVARQRFCREARAAAAVTHDNLVAVHQVDEDEGSGLPYLVMQLVHGESLEQRLKKVGKLSIHDVARLGMQAAAGLAAAHAGKLIHRDIKPGNILLEDPVDRVKLTDFGLARAAEDVKLTRTGFVAGSPLYMAPEQARGDEVDPRSDLFSLGSVLYEAATGTAPFEAKTPLAVLKRVADETPPSLLTVDAEVPDWLSEIVDKLLAKDPADRIQSAAEVAELFAAGMSRDHVLSPLDVPAEVCPAAAASRSGTARVRPRICWKGVAFRTLPWLGGIAVGAALMAAITLPDSAAGNGRYDVAMKELGEFRAQTLGLTTELDGAKQELAKTRLAQAPAGPAPKWVLKGQWGSVWAVAFIPNEDQVVLGYEDGSMKIWDLKTQEVHKSLERMNGTVWTVDVSFDHKYMVAACDDSKVNLWDLKKQYKNDLSLPHPTSTKAVAFSPTELKVATGDRGATIRIWDLLALVPVELNGHRGTVHSLAYSPDGKLLASAGSDGTIRLWNLQAVKEATPQHPASPTSVLEEHKGAVYSVAFSPDGKYLASAGWDGTARVWNVADGAQVKVLKPHDGDAWSVSFGNNGKWLAVAAMEMVRVYDLETEKEIFTYRGPRAFHTVRFAADGKTLAAGGRDGALRVWELK